MNPEEHLRTLKDPDRWTGVRVPQAVQSESTAPPRSFARVVPGIAAFVLAVAAVIGLGFGFGSLGRGGGPAALPSRDATPSGSPTASACGAAKLTVSLGASAPLPAYWLETIEVMNAGDPCSLPAAAFTVAGFSAGDGWGVVDGAVTVPSGTSQLYLQAARASTGDTAPGTPKTGVQPALVTLRIDGAVHTLGAVAFTGSWGDPVLGQHGEGQVYPADKLARLAAEDAQILAARATAAPKPVYTPPPSTPTSTPPTPTVACTWSQLAVSTGEFGGAVGNWVQAVVLQNTGTACFLLPSQFRVGTAVGAGGDVTRLAVQPGRSLADVMTAVECFTKSGTSHGPQKKDTPLVLTIGGTSRTIGTFGVVPCGVLTVDR